MTRIMASALALSYAVLLLDADELPRDFCLHDYQPPPFTYHALSVSPNVRIAGDAGTVTDETRTDQGGARWVKRDLTERGPADLRGSLSTYQRLHHYALPWEIRTDNRFYVNGDYSPSRSSEETIIRPPDGLRLSTSRHTDSEVYLGLGTDASIRYDMSLPLFWRIDLAAQLNGSPYSRRTKEHTLVSRSTFGSPTMVDYDEERTGYRTKRLNADLRFAPAVGVGRVRDVTYAAVALAMLDRIDARPVSAAQIQHFAAHVESRKRRRSYDSRLALIRDIHSLHDFLGEKNVAGELTDLHVLELVDQWLYGFRQERSAGFELCLQPGIAYRKDRWWEDESTSNRTSHLPAESDLTVTELRDWNPGGAFDHFSDRNETTTRHTSPYLELNLAYARPLGRYLQLEADALSRGMVTMASYSSVNTTSDSSWTDHTSSSFPAMILESTITLSWYPTTRTTMTAGFSSTYDREFDYIEAPRDITAPHHDRRDLRIGPLLRFDYYVSPRLSWRLWARVTVDDLYDNGTEDPVHRRIGTASRWIESERKVYYTLEGSLRYALF
jgi:hypothetical protein